MNITNFGVSDKASAFSAEWVFMKKKSNHPILGAVFRFLAMIFTYICFRPSVKFINKRKIKDIKGNPVIFIFNHTSYFDGVLTSVIAKNFKHYTVVAKDWYEKKNFTFFLDLYRSIPIDRYNPDAEWYISASDKIKNGYSICIFPEGSTSKSGVMKPFHPGFALLALEHNIPVVPVAIGGKYKIIFGKRQRILIGDPIYVADNSNVRKSRIASSSAVQMQQTIEKMLCRIKNIEYKGENSNEQTGNSGKNQINACGEPSNTRRCS